MGHGNLQKGIDELELRWHLYECKIAICHYIEASIADGFWKWN